LVLSEELDLCLSYLRQAFSLSSTSLDIQYHIAYTLAKLQRIHEAKKVLIKLIALPDDFEEHQLAQRLFDKLDKNKKNYRKLTKKGNYIYNKVCVYCTNALLPPIIYCVKYTTYGLNFFI
jgi:hypothetical protein